MNNVDKIVFLKELVWLSLPRGEVANELIEYLNGMEAFERCESDE